MLRLSIVETVRLGMLWLLLEGGQHIIIILCRDIYIVLSFYSVWSVFGQVLLSSLILK